MLCRHHGNMLGHMTQVIDLISLKPFDLEAITKSIKKTRKCIIVEECMKTGGIGASLSAVINESLFNELDHEVRWVACLTWKLAELMCCNLLCWLGAA